VRPKKSKKAPCVAVMGTGSDVGKSLVVTALCRIFLQQGWVAAPFKAQNMSNNSGVTPDGLEIGRAQIVQAEAAGMAPHVDMNPILLKPSGDARSQTVVLGRAEKERSARDFYREKDRLFNVAKQALDRLRRSCDVVVMEGAGSCAEMNLMAHDIVNLPMAEYADAPVILVADIHRGGVFAQIMGTLACLDPKHREMIKGFVINRFRGDARLFDSGVEWIEARSGKKVFGVWPWHDDIVIEPEDSTVIERPEISHAKVPGSPAIGVLRLPRISNFNDFTPLSHGPDLNLFFLERAIDLDFLSALILPGSKNTRGDMQWIQSTGWADKIRDYAAKGGHILGICGGYQMLGESIRDPLGLDGAPGQTPGLGLLPIVTELKSPKITTLSTFSWDGIPGSGYEIHMGRTIRKKGAPLIRILSRGATRAPAPDAPLEPDAPLKPDQTDHMDRHQDGCVAPSGKIMGTYIHGLFDNPEIMKKWLASIGLHHVNVPEKGGLEMRNGQYDRLAKHFQRHVNINEIMTWVQSEMGR